MKKASLLNQFFFAVILSIGFCFEISAQKPPALKLSDPLPANLFVELAKTINPAVVNISTSTIPKNRGRRQRDPMMDMLEQFYGLQMRPMEARPQQALGTGFIIREDGLIVTNNHVVAGADVINVQLVDSANKKKSFEAEIIGSDERTDIALIKITTQEKLPVAQLGSSKDLEVGEWVAAFGNPYGNDHTLTKGIISAKGRDIAEINKFPLIQTDAPINPGNSGGPLVSSKGLVIGVNSAIDARAQGIGFAIPIDEVKSIIPQLEKVGHIRKAYLGVGLGDIDPMAAAQLGIKDTEGAVIMQVERNSPADKAGLSTYDIITEFNGKKVKGSQELRDFVADAKIGSKIPVKAIREGKEKSFTVTVVERVEPKAKIPAVKKYFGQKAPFNLGFTIADTTDALRKDFDISEKFKKQPVVVEVNRNSPAAAAGLQPGDVIFDVNKIEINNAKDVLKYLKSGQRNTIRLSRAGEIAILIL